jgi:HK97 family phage prohead protease
MELERRAQAGKIEVRRDGGSVKIVGYAAIFNSMSEDLGGFREIIRPGAFERALASGQDVRGLVNHDPNLLLGRTASGTMRLAEDDRGLRYEIDPPDTQVATDLITLLERGDLDGSSFAFTLAENGDAWRDEHGKVVREIHKVGELFDVGPVVYPAYRATVSSVAVRSVQARVVAADNPETKRSMDVVFHQIISSKLENVKLKSQRAKR